MEVFYIYFQMVSLLLVFAIACATLIFYPQPPKEISGGSKHNRIGRSETISQGDRKG